MKGSIKLVIYCLILFLWTFTQCGIPSNNLYDDLNTPKNLTFVSYATGVIQITFSAYNPEVTFTGFNVYMHPTSEAELRTQHSNHVNPNTQEVNTAIEINYIVKNEISINYPTIQDSDPGANVIGIRINPGTVTYTIQKAPNLQTLSGSYFVGISAYSTTTHIESALSNVVQTP